MMACGRSSPPSSPRAPKIQQDSWDDCESPPIDLFDPNNPVSPIRHPLSSASSSSLTRKLRNSSSDSKSARSPDYNHASPTSQMKFIYGNNVSIADEAPRSPKYTMFKTPSPNAPSNTNFTDLASGTLISSGQRSPNYLPTYENHQQISPRRSPNVPNKFTFDAVSPRQDSNASLTGFSVASPIGTIDTHEFDLVKQNSTIYNKPYCPPTAFIARSGKLKRQLSLHHNNHNPHKNNPLYPQQHHQHHKQQQQMHKKLTNTTTASTSLHNNSTNYDLIKQSSEPHSIYHHSNLINDLYNHSQIANEQSPGGTNTSTTTTTTADICYDSGHSTTDTNRHNRSNSARKRQPINITPNPGYQPLNTSHSTLDRTCSDSVVSLSSRKSTSDLTTVTESSKMPATASHHRRRGSSKGGLALLASRRNSRDSIKSVASNSSLFSNEDIGPLAFQASARGRQRRTSNFLELPVPDHQRPRVCSLPDRPYNPRQSDDLYRLRTFSISKGTVVNCGDSIISRRSRSNTSVNSTTSRASERSPFEGSCCGAGYADVDSLPPSPTDSEPLPPQRYRVVLFGDAGTGKTALVSQFMTSEYMHTYDASLDDEFGEKTVSILLDGEESEIVFIDHPSSEMSVENSLSTYEPHGCVIVYSVVQRASFRQAEEMVKYLWRENITKEKAVILVGNKADLARSRVITTAEGKALAKSIEAKFIETSSGIQHNVDELLVGILKQIRLKETRDKKAAAQNAMKMRNSRTHISLHLAKEILQKIRLSDITKSKSCENLHVL